MKENKKDTKSPKYPGILMATDGTTATVEAETNRGYARVG
jgi:hypothetical protein